MSAKNWLWGAVEAVLWYAFIYYFLFVLNNEVEIAKAALILLVLLYLASLSCPLVRNSCGWRKMMGKCGNCGKCSTCGKCECEGCTCN